MLLDGILRVNFYNISAKRKNLARCTIACLKHVAKFETTCTNHQRIALGFVTQPRKVKLFSVVTGCE